MRLLALGSLLIALSISVGCSPVRVEGPDTYSHQGIVITPKHLQLKGGRLRLRLTFENHTESEVAVNLNLMSLIMPDGQVAARHKFTGTFGGEESSVHSIAPGESDDVFVDFKLEGEPPEDLRLVLTGVLSGGKSMELPSYEIKISKD